VAKHEQPYVIRVYLSDPEDIEVTKAIVGPFDNPALAGEALEAAGYRRSTKTIDPLQARWEPEWVEIVPLMESIPRE
jgi:hypothetical protein